MLHGCHEKNVAHKFLPLLLLLLLVFLVDMKGFHLKSIFNHKSGQLCNTPLASGGSVLGEGVAAVQGTCVSGTDQPNQPQSILRYFRRPNQAVEQP